MSKKILFLVVLSFCSVAVAQPAEPIVDSAADRVMSQLLGALNEGQDGELAGVELMSESSRSAAIRSAAGLQTAGPLVDVEFRELPWSSEIKQQETTVQLGGSATVTVSALGRGMLRTAVQINIDKNAVVRAFENGYDGPLFEIVEIDEAALTALTYGAETATLEEVLGGNEPFADLIRGELAALNGGEDTEPAPGMINQPIAQGAPPPPQGGSRGPTGGAQPAQPVQPAQGGGVKPGQVGPAQAPAYVPVNVDCEMPNDDTLICAIVVYDPTTGHVFVKFVMLCRNSTTGVWTPCGSVGPIIVV